MHCWLILVCALTQGSNLQPWCIGMLLLATELPGQGLLTFHCPLGPAHGPMALTPSHEMSGFNLPRTDELTLCVPDELFEV